MLSLAIKDAGGHGRQMIRQFSTLAATAAIWACTGCATPGIGGPPQRHDLSAQIIIADDGSAPNPGTALSVDAQGTCWARERVAAEAARPADPETDPTGAPEPLRPRKPVKPGQIIRFPTPCPDVTDSAFIATLQRALGARGYYHGAATGQMDAATRQALRAYQDRRGLPSGTLSIGAAREMGLIITPLDLL